MKKSLVLLASFLLAAPAFAADPPKTEQEKTLYAIGNTVSRSLSVFNLKKDEFEMVMLGLKDAQNGKKADFDVQSYTPKVQELARARRKELGESQVAAGKVFLENAAKEKGAEKLPSGMVYQSLAEGKGTSPKSTDIVKVQYKGTLPDGKEFDSSYKRGKPLEFKLDNVIKCWTEALQKMKPGGKAKLVCPSHLAYGETGAGELILPGATLAFEVELLEFKPSTEPAKAPAASVTKPAEQKTKQ